MTQYTREYQAASALAQRARREPLPAPMLDWQTVRQWLGPLALLVIVIGLYVLQSLFTTTSELEIGRLAKARDTLLHHNTQLAADIAELEKPSRVRARARALGLVDISKSIRLPVTASVADADDTLPDAAAESWWQQLFTDIARRLTDATQ